MDSTTARLVDFALGMEFSSLPSETVHECKRRLIDTFACAIGAYDEPLSCMARAVARRQTGNPSASVWGCSWTTTPEAAAFANGVMLRLDDISDNYRVKSGGHPSDVIAGILAVGEAVHADGRSVINAITLAYDVYCSFCESYDFNSKGWDQPVYGVVACVLGAGRLLALSREQMGHAVALALAPNLALFQTRCGNLSSWKGCAGANASRNAVFAALLAKDGFTGPHEVFEGKCGLWDVAGKFVWNPEIGAGSPHRVMQTHFKRFPVCGHGQSAAEAATRLFGKVQPQDGSDITVETYRVAVEQMASDASRWSPTTRETADHSLPFVVAVALLDGEVTSRSFSAERLSDPVVLSLMRRIKVTENRNYSDKFPEAWPCRVQVRLKSGECLVSEVMNPKGHANNPMDDTELEAKFVQMFREYGNVRQCDAALRGLSDFEHFADIRDLLALFCLPERRLAAVT
jgi:2-methylcitrate dehydratase